MAIDRTSYEILLYSAVGGIIFFNSPYSDLGDEIFKSNISGDIYDIVRAASHKHKVEPKLIMSIIKQESNFKKDAVSNVGASGLMQLMPSTAKWLGVKDIFDPYENVMAGTKYFKKQYTKYKDIKLALAAYNAGPGNVDKYKGIPPFPETENYVKKITKNYESDWLSEEELDRLKTGNFIKRSYMKTLLYSVFIPGGGELYNKNYTLGFTLMTAQLGFLYGTYYWYNKAEDYKSETQKYEDSRLVMKESLVGVGALTLFEIVHSLRETWKWNSRISQEPKYDVSLKIENNITFYLTRKF